MTDAFVGLGSNLGDRRTHLRQALKELEECGRVTGVSSLYETEPVGVCEQGMFLNAVARLETGLTAETLLERLLEIEQRHGRIRKERYGPRTLDLDLLLWGGGEVRTRGLETPHPRMHERRFVLVPLCELAPGEMHPALGRTARELLDSLEGGAGVRVVEGWPAWGRR